MLGGTYDSQAEQFLQGNVDVDVPRSRHIIIVLVALSVVTNSLATVSWLVDADQNVPAETKAAWEKLLGRASYEKSKREYGDD